MSSPGLIAFDLEGTLIDSLGGLHASLQAACDALQLQADTADAVTETLRSDFRQHHDQHGWCHCRLDDGCDNGCDE